MNQSSQDKRSTDYVQSEVLSSRRRVDMETSSNIASHASSRPGLDGGSAAAGSACRGQHNSEPRGGADDIIPKGEGRGRIFRWNNCLAVCPQLLMLACMAAILPGSSAQNSTCPRFSVPVEIAGSLTLRCVCVDGYFQGPQSCEHTSTCPVASYCPDGGPARPCPINMTTAEGAVSAEDCYCVKEGFFNQNGTCIEVEFCPASFFCTNGRSTAQSLFLATPPGIRVLNSEGEVDVAVGAVAGFPLDVQPSVELIVGPDWVPPTSDPPTDPFISVVLETNPGCGTLRGNTHADLVHVGGVWKATFTNLKIENVDGRDLNFYGNSGKLYVLRFCLGDCFGENLVKDVRDTQTVPFAVRSGVLEMEVEPGGAIANRPFSIQPSIRIKGVVVNKKAEEFLVTNREFDFGVTVSFNKPGVKLFGRRTIWPRLGIVEFTDLMLQTAGYAANNFRLIFTTCYGTPQVDCDADDGVIPDTAMSVVSNLFSVEHNDPTSANVEQQPNRIVVAGRAIGSECSFLVGSECMMPVPVDPLRVSIIDDYGNRVLTGSWVACANLYVNNSLVEDRHAGDAVVVLQSGFAVFDNYIVVAASQNYFIKFNLFEYDALSDGDPASVCGGVPFAVTQTRRFNVSFSSAANIGIRSPQPFDVPSAGLPLRQNPRIGFLDGAGNLVSVASCPGSEIQRQFCKLRISVEIDTIQDAYTRVTTPPLFFEGTCLRIGGLCIGQPKVNVAAVNGIGEFTDLVLKMMGNYTLRFYAEALQTISTSFYVSSAPAVEILTESSPGTSACLGTDFRCLFGGTLVPLPRFSLWDEFQNLARDGVFAVTISFVDRPPDQRALFACEQAKGDGGIQCGASSQRGYVQFTDLAVDFIALGVTLELTIDGRGSVGASRTSTFDVLSLMDVRMVNEPVRTAALCPIFPPPTVELLGFTTELESQPSLVPIHDGEVSVFALQCGGVPDSFQVLYRGFPQVSGNYDLLPGFNTNQRLDEKIYGTSSGYRLYYCKEDGKENRTSPCAAGYFWAISTKSGEDTRCQRPWGQAARDFEYIWSCDTYRPGNTPVRPDVLSNQQWFSAKVLAPPDDTTFQMVDTSDFFLSAQPQACNKQDELYGRTIENVNQGISVMDDIRISKTGLFSLRFITKLFGGVTAITKDFTYEVYVDSLQSMTVVDPPGTLGKDSLGMASIRLINSINLPPTPWNCTGHECFSFDGLFDVRAEVLLEDGDPLPMIVGDAYERDGDPGVLVFPFTPTAASIRNRIVFTAGYTSTCGSTRGRNVLTTEVEPFDILTRPSRISVIRASPTRIIAGQNFPVSATVLDEGGAVIVSFVDVVLKLYKEDQITPGEGLKEICGAPLPRADQCSPLETLRARGTAVFPNVTITVAGTYYLRFELGPPFQDLVSDWGATIRVVNRPLDEMTLLRISQQPSTSVRAGAFFNPPVAMEITDVFLNRIPDSIDVLNMRVWTTADPVEQKFGPQTITLSAGVYEWPGLTLTRLNEGAELEGCISVIQFRFKGNVALSRGSLDLETSSDGVTLTPDTPSVMRMLLQPAPDARADSRLPIQPAVKVADRFDNAICNTRAVTIPVKVIECTICPEITRCQDLDPPRICPLQIGVAPLGYGVGVFENLQITFPGNWRLHFSAVVYFEELDPITQQASERSVNLENTSTPILVLPGSVSQGRLITNPRSSVSEEGVRFSGPRLPEFAGCQSCTGLTLQDGAGNDITFPPEGGLFPVTVRLECIAVSNPILETTSGRTVEPQRFSNGVWGAQFTGLTIRVPYETECLLRYFTQGRELLVSVLPIYFRVSVVAKLFVPDLYRARAGIVIDEFAVELRDRNDFLVAASTRTVTIDFEGATCLDGGESCLSVAAVNGRARFSD
eukprot:2573281-Rhodomonas_salina.1